MWPNDPKLGITDNIQQMIQSAKKLLACDVLGFKRSKTMWCIGQLIISPSLLGAPPPVSTPPLPPPNLGGSEIINVRAKPPNRGKMPINEFSVLIVSSRGQLGANGNNSSSKGITQLSLTIETNGEQREKPTQSDSQKHVSVVDYHLDDLALLFCVLVGWWIHISG
jgi:hypothetical protein